MDSETILFDKDGFKFIRVRKNHYKLSFNMENNNIIISKIIDFNLIKLIYDLNQDVYEKVNIQKINDNVTNFQGTPNQVLITGAGTAANPRVLSTPQDIARTLLMPAALSRSSAALLVGVVTWSKFARTLPASFQSFDLNLFSKNLGSGR
jgi:hypothetical protein